MTVSYDAGRYTIRVSTRAADIVACQALRHRCFHGEPGQDVDQFDETAAHVLISDKHAGRLVGTLRFWVGPGCDLRLQYAAQSYDLSGFGAVQETCLEIGRFCTDPAAQDPQILRAAWQVITRIVKQEDARFVVGCASFPGVSAVPFANVFQQLYRHHLGPLGLRPTHKAPDVVDFADVCGTDAPQLPMPALLRSYLAMGGWVSDHAVIDAKLQTLHVFTALDVVKVPDVRARTLRGLAGVDA